MRRHETCDVNREPTGAARHGWYVLSADRESGAAITPSRNGWQVGGSDSVFATWAEAVDEAKRRLGRGARLVHRGIVVDGSGLEDAT